jgi:tetratricopeptide (TPR) repeat protein
MAAIFISHSSRDEELAERMKAWLAEQGYEQVFIDFDKHTGLQVGEHWERRLYEEIARCHAVVLILTPNWLDSKWCFVEFTQARALGKIIFPIVLSPLGDQRVAPEIQGIDLKDWNRDGQDYLRRRIREITDEVARGFKWDRARSPYPGIHSFDQDDAAIFFGRDAEIREVVERLEARRIHGGKRLLLILGASGSGKSSLMKAGVLPQLARDPARWIVLPPFRPDRDPLATFAKCLAQKLARPDTWRNWRDRLAGNTAAAALKELADDLRIGEALSATILIPIDQFEEIFTLAQPQERKPFLDFLRIAAGNEQLPCQTVATVRSDVLGALLQSAELELGFDDYPLSPMPLTRLPKLIEGPAGVAALTLERGLAHRIAEDVRSSDALPLLAFALRELYERFGEERRLTIHDYEQLSGNAGGASPIATVIRRKADDILKALRPAAAELAAVKRAFIPHLVRAREDGTFVRQPARLANLPAPARPLINAFVNARLMTTRIERSEDGQASAMVEVAHESLFAAWPLLARWLDEEREFLAGKAQLVRFLSDWRAAPPPQKHDALLQGLYLARAKAWLGTARDSLSHDEVSFIEASLRRARGRVWLLSGLSVAVLLLIGMVVTPRVYAEYARRVALECDLDAAEQDNNVHVPGVEFDRIVPDVAIPACEHAIAADPENARLSNNLGRAFDKAGRYADAVFWYRRAADLDYDLAQNNLGVMYLNGRGVAPDIAQGVSLLRAAAAKGNADAIANYQEADYSTLFEDSPDRARILETALRDAGFLKPEDVTGMFGPPARQAVEVYKQKAGLSDPGITLRVIDRLGIAAKLQPHGAAIETSTTPRG